MSGIRAFSRLVPFFDADGTSPAAGHFIYAYVTGTSTLTETYADVDLLIANANPITLDADGRLPVDMFVDPTVTYRIVQKDTLGNTIAEDDPLGVNDATASIAAHNADPDAHLDAAEGQRGMVELASTAMVLAGTDTASAVTPAGLAARTATSTRTGISERATGAETETGTDNERHTTPLGIQSLHPTAAEILAAATGDTHFMGPDEFAQNFSGSSTTAVWKFPGGYKLIIGQWLANQDTAQTVTFASPFSSYCSGVFVQVAVENQNGAVVSWTKDDFVWNRDDDAPDATNYYLAFGK